MQTRTQTYFAQAEETVTPGANLGFGNNTVNLNNVVESLVADGKHAVIKSITVWTRAYQVDVDSSLERFSLQPVIVQTAGTFTDTANLTNREISEVLDQCIDDEFGVMCIGDFRNSKAVPSDADQHTYGIETKSDIPKSICNLLSKEGSTERLQDIVFGYVGLASDNIAIKILSFYRIKFVERTKGITIR